LSKSYMDMASKLFTFTTPLAVLMWSSRRSAHLAYTSPWKLKAIRPTTAWIHNSHIYTWTGCGLAG